VLLLDRQGEVRHSSGPVPPSGELRLDSPTCQACHRFPAAERSNSQVIETSDGAVLRTVTPFRNQQVCHRCHDPRHGINGVMLFDMDASETQSAMTADLRWMVAGSSVLAMLLIAVIVAMVKITMSESMSALVDAVREQRERLEVVINSIDDGIVVLDTGRRIVAANDAFLRRAQASRQELLGCSCSHKAPAACSGHECPTLACLASGERQVRICERRTSTGDAAWEEVHASPIRAASGVMSHVVEVWRDISERRSAEARLAESYRLASLGLLASGYSHELNTPLGTVLTCIDGILRDARTSVTRSSVWDHVREAAATAREQVLRCRQITQHFLKVSRGDESSELVELQAVLGTVDRLVQPTAREHGVTLSVGAAPTASRVRINEADLQQAIINLLLNAVQASPRGATVDLEIDRDEHVRIRVRDRGCGVAPADQRRIFEPFFSLRPGGTGLGLFMCQQTVRRAGGELHLSSAPGAGSTFEIVLPAAPPAVETRCV
jgi:PAS domain S-box-containing protein